MQIAKRKGVAFPALIEYDRANEFSTQLKRVLTKKRL